MGTFLDDAFLAYQRAELLRFMANAAVRDGFGWLDDGGNVDESRPVELWITCRMTHVAALGVLAKEPNLDGGPDASELRALASHGVRALASGPLRDAAHRGWFASVEAGEPRDTAKQAYGHAFVVLAASSAAAASIPGADALLEEALAVSQKRFWDPRAGLSVEEWDAAWTTLDGYRGVNANMHTVEAYLAAGDVTGESSWHRKAAQIAHRVSGWAAANDWRIPEHFDSQWTPLLQHNKDTPADPFRPYGATVGHGLEWARLMLSVARTVGDSDTLVAAAVDLYDRAVADGWAVDGADGFVYTTDWSGEPVVRQRMHWVVAEAVNAAEALWQVTSRERYARDRDRWWDYATQYLIDADRGSWHHELSPANGRSALVWPGKPDVYHAYQAALLPRVGIVPSFAAALRDSGGVG